MIQRRFPNIGSYVIRSPATSGYNCIAWAAGDADRWWWPDPDYYWPEQASREPTLDAFVAAFRPLGYEVCEDASLEAGYEKIALYATESGEPTHATRQLPSGGWTSKLGKSKDIEHETPGSVEGSVYGRVCIIMKRHNLAFCPHLDGGDV